MPSLTQISRAPADTDAAVTGDEPTMSESRPSILVADDQPETLRGVSFALEQAGYSVLVATSGCAALQSARANRPDLILLGVHLRDLSGVDVCRQLSQDAATHDLPVIFLASPDERESLGQGLRAGGVDSIDKPFEAEQGLARVRTHLELRRLRRYLGQSDPQARCIGSVRPGTP